MDDNEPKEFDNLSNFARDLQEIEGRDGGVTDPARANEVRDGLISAMRGYVKSLYDFAEQLNRYHKLFKSKKTATVAMVRIAVERGCSSRTLYRLLESLRKSKQLPLIFMDAMREEGIDPLRGKNQLLVKTLTAAPEPANRKEAESSLKAARTKVLKMAPGARKARNLAAVDATQATQTTEAADATQTTQATDAIQTTQTTDTTQAVQTSQTIGAAHFADAEIDEFATSIVRMFEERFGGCDDADRNQHVRSVLARVVNALHVDVRELRNERPLARVQKPAKKKP